MAHYLDVHHDLPVVSENTFIAAPQDLSTPPSFADVRHRLPQPYWDTPHGVIAVRAYWYTFSTLFKNLKSATRENGFAGPYADAAFNECLFMWDAAFMAPFWRYASRAHDFQRSFDTFYKKQHKDGFISREIRERDGTDQFHRHDASSTGPNVLAWCEWEHYLSYGDKKRLAAIFPALLGYHSWMRTHRGWPDGSYWTCGLGSGMDNQPRVLPGDSAWVSHSKTAWMDATAQAALSARTLVRMAEELGQASRSEVSALRAEVAHLASYVNVHMWDAGACSYTDRRLEVAAGVRRDVPELSPVRSVGAYWALLAGLVPPERIDAFVAHLDDPAQFNRPVRVPSLSRAHPEYNYTGGYWLGGVWPSTNYMVLRGLSAVKRDDVAADIAANYHAAVVDLFSRTATVWENMAPEGVPSPGDPAKPEFVGWGGIAPLAVLFEYIFGLRPDTPSNTLVFDVRLLDRFGVTSYPFGSGVVHIECAARKSASEEPVVTIRSSVPLRLVVQWGKTASAVGGVRPDHRAGQPTAPLFERVVVVPVDEGVAAEASAARGGGAAAGGGVPRFDLPPIGAGGGGGATAATVATLAAALGTMGGAATVQPVIGAGDGSSSAAAALAAASAQLDERTASLVSMGFERTAAQHALAAAGGDVESALLLLLE